MASTASVAPSALSDDAVLFDTLLRLGDNCLILAQQIGKWCGHAPELEEDIALANIGLDLIGQTQMWLAYAGEVEGSGRSADDLAFLRSDREFRNFLLVEQTDDDYAMTIMRQCLFDFWHFHMIKGVCASSDSRMADIAAKAFKEVSYHARRSGDLVERLGDGSEESHRRMQAALGTLWFTVEELHTPDEIDVRAHELGLIPDLDAVGSAYRAALQELFDKANLVPPAQTDMRHGGKSGLHGERFSYLLAEMQSVHRNFPGAKW